jgi:DNA-binding XRE family transcriptional regulator
MDQKSPNREHTTRACVSKFSVSAAEHSRPEFWPGWEDKMSYILNTGMSSGDVRLESCAASDFDRRVDQAVGGMIKQQRTIRNMSSARLADLADVDAASLVLIEAGVRRPAALDLLAIASSLHVDVSTFFVTL